MREVKRAFGALRVSKRDLDLQHRSAVIEGFNSYSPIIVMTTFRRWGDRRCSNRKMPCHVPIPTAFSAGFMKDSRDAAGKIFGPSPTSFGHPGAGGSHAFADPENRIAFAYVMNQMEQSVLPNEKSLRLVDAIYT